MEVVRMFHSNHCSTFFSFHSEITEKNDDYNDNDNDNNNNNNNDNDNDNDDNYSTNMKIYTDIIPQVQPDHCFFMRCQSL